MLIGEESKDKWDKVVIIIINIFLLDSTYTMLDNVKELNKKIILKILKISSVFYLFIILITLGKVV